MSPRSHTLKSARPAVHPAVVFAVILLPVGITGTFGPVIGPLVQGPGLGSNITVYMNGTLQAGSLLGNHSGNRFFEVVLSDVLTPTSVLRSLGSFLNSTPIGIVRFGGTGDGYNPTTQVNYQPPSSGSGTFVGTHQQLWNLTWFKSWCASQTPRCAWLSYLPGEENDTKAALHYANWYHKVLGLAPTYWEFGNEPTQWKHFGLNMSKWSTTDTLQPSAIAYATMVKNYIAAITAVYPNDKFIGLEAACACNKLMASTVAQVDGSKIVGMAYHSYPSSSISSSQLTGFYSLLNSSASINSSSGRYRAAILGGCPSCKALPVELGEYQAGPFSAFSPFINTYAGAPWYAASVIQAIQANLSAITLYNSNNLYNVNSSTPTFQGLLYSRILNNMTMGL
ncbi:MAG TPA: hypothetical protein VEY07_01265, partial [Thermoplasmata archaeon]|nr:hypothetical protein [Thermoplasmata archaeon]